jgi:hypothetical protein
MVMVTVMVMVMVIISPLMGEMIVVDCCLSL